MFVWFPKIADNILLNKGLHEWITMFKVKRNMAAAGSWIIWAGKA